MCQLYSVQERLQDTDEMTSMITSYMKKQPEMVRPYYYIFELLWKLLMSGF